MKKNRFLAILLTLTLILACMPAAVFADDNSKYTIQMNGGRCYYYCTDYPEEAYWTYTGRSCSVQPGERINVVYPGNIAKYNEMGESSYEAKEFDHWIAEGIEIENPTDYGFSFIMPASDVTITAVCNDTLPIKGVFTDEAGLVTSMWEYEEGTNTLSISGTGGFSINYGSDSSQWDDRFMFDPNRFKSGLKIVVGEGIESVNLNGEFIGQNYHTDVSLSSTVNSFNSFYIGVDNIEVDPNNSCYSSENNMLLSADGSILYLIGSSVVGEAVIPDTVETINMMPNNNVAEKVTSVVIPEGVKQIISFPFGNEVTISGYTGSPAETYAYSNGYKFVSLGSASYYQYATKEELESLRSQLNDALAVAAAAQEAATTAEEALNAANEELSEANAQILTLNETIESNEATIEEKNAAISAKEAALEQATTDLENANAQLETARSDLEKANSDLAAAQEQVTALEGQLETTQGDLGAANEEIEALKSDLAAEKEKLQASQTELAEKQAALEDATTRYNETKNDLDAAVQEVANLKAELASVKAELQTTKAEKEQAEADLAAKTEELNAAKEAEEQAKAEAQAAKEAEESAKAEAQAAKTAEADAIAAAEAANERVTALTEEKESLEQQLAEAEDSNEAIQAELDRVNSELTTAQQEKADADAAAAAATEEKNQAQAALEIAQAEKDQAISAKNAAEQERAKAEEKAKAAEEELERIKAQLSASNIKNAVISGASDMTYTGSAIEPAVTVKLGDKMLTAGTDYSVYYVDNISVGTATIIITGEGNFDGACKATFKINQADIKTASIAGAVSTAYKGSKITPAVKVKLNNRQLSSGTDYSVAFKNNVSVGTATVTVTGKGNYKGTCSTSFKITKAANTMTAKAKAKTHTFKFSKLKKTNQTITAAKAYTISKNKGALSYKLTGVTKSSFKKYFSVNAKTGNITIKKKLKKGTYTLSVKVTAKGTANYKAASKTLKVKVIVK